MNDKRKNCNTELFFSELQFYFALFAGRFLSDERSRRSPLP